MGFGVSLIGRMPPSQFLHPLYDSWRGMGVTLFASVTWRQCPQFQFIFFPAQKSKFLLSCEQGAPVWGLQRRQLESWRSQNCSCRVDVRPEQRSAAHASRCSDCTQPRSLRQPETFLPLQVTHFNLRQKFSIQITRRLLTHTHPLFAVYGGAT